MSFLVLSRREERSHAEGVSQTCELFNERSKCSKLFFHSCALACTNRLPGRHTKVWSPYYGVQTLVCLVEWTVCVFANPRGSGMRRASSPPLWVIICSLRPAVQCEVKVFHSFFLGRAIFWFNDRLESLIGSNGLAFAVRQLNGLFPIRQMTLSVNTQPFERSSIVRLERIIRQAHVSTTGDHGVWSYTTSSIRTVACWDFSCHFSWSGAWFGLPVTSLKLNEQKEENVSIVMLVPPENSVSVSRLQKLHRFNRDS